MRQMGEAAVLFFYYVFSCFDVVCGGKVCMLSSGISILYQGIIEQLW